MTREQAGARLEALEAAQRYRASLGQSETTSEFLERIGALVAVIKFDVEKLTGLHPKPG